jgi:hypothetical protein
LTGRNLFLREPPLPPPLPATLSIKKVVKSLSIKKVVKSLSIKKVVKGGAAPAAPAAPAAHAAPAAPAAPAARGVCIKNFHSRRERR